MPKGQDTRVCTACEVARPMSEFGKAAGYRDGRRSQCRVCRTSYERGRRRRPDYKRPDTQLADRNRGLMRKYGINLSDYQTMLDSQNGRCAICAKSPTWKYGVLVVDHCHESGRIRGLLCHNCNRAIGLLGDTAETLRRVVAYLSGGSHGY